jgi:response regulator RpfG family c-di-GMP phosphodiesterase
MTDTIERPLTLLFVDDEPGILAALRRLFRPHGYRILTAESGAEGLEVLGREEVDLVVSDMRMPNMDGAKFLREVRARRPQVVRLLLTGYADIASTIEAINHGEIYRYISKPWDDDEIVHTVKDALERKRLERENLRLVELTTRQNEELKELNASLEQKVAARTAEVQQTLAFLEQAHKELKRGFMGTVRVFSASSNCASASCRPFARRRTCAVGQRSARRRGGPDVLMVALLHDIGKIGLSDEILTAQQPVAGRPRRGHATPGHRPDGDTRHRPAERRGAPDPPPSRSASTQRLSRPTGGSRFAGRAHPAVANDFDALQMACWSTGRSVADAWTFILENRGKRYDPQVVDAFAVLLAETQPAEMVIEVPMRPGTARPGMVLTRDLMHKDGYLLLAKGQVLDANIIEQLVRLEAMEKQHLTLHIRQEVK